VSGNEGIDVEDEEPG